MMALGVEEKKIMIVGCLWLISGLMAAFFGYLDTNITCDCFTIAIRATANRYCICPNGTGFLGTGILACFVGASMIVMRQRVLALKAELSKKRAK
jgi:hypothetical protein